MITDDRSEVTCVKTAFEDQCIAENGITSRRRADKKKRIVNDQHNDDDEDEEAECEDGIFKSKNLIAERKRRKKLNDKQLELRSLVPIITNMNKATIITDAITYIEKLKNTVEELTLQLQEMEAIPDKEETKFEEIDTEREMKKYGISPEVEVNRICGTKVWIKIVFKKKKGSLTKLIEAINVIGYVLTDTSISTSSGAVLFTSSAEKTLQGIGGGETIDADQIKRFLLEITKSF